MLLRFLMCSLTFLFAFSAWARPIQQNFQNTSEDYLADELLIKFKSQVTTQDLTQFNRQLSVAAVSREDAITQFHQHFKTKIIRKPSLGPQRVRLPLGKSVKTMLADIAANALIEYAEPNYRVYAANLSTTYTATAAYNDPYYTDGRTQWWLNRTRADVAKTEGFPWGGSSDVIVAVLDTGVDGSHADLAGRLVAGHNYADGNSDTSDNNTMFGSVAVLGHGTHVAGVIAAIHNNASGIAGTAWDNHIKIMPVKVLGSDGSGDVAHVSEGIDFAVTNSAMVINMSLGVDSDSTTLRQACIRAYNAGVVIVAAAGNQGRNLQVAPYFPGSYNIAIAVAATDSMDKATAYSNYGAGMLDCAAPGGAIYSYWDSYGSVYRDRDFGVTSTANTGSWSAVDGTSFAAPQVAALAALLRLQDPTRSNDAVKNLISSNCDQTDVPIRVGPGRINILRALSHSTPAPTRTITPTLTITRTITRTPTYTITPSITHTLTVTLTRTITLSRTITPTHTITPTSTPMQLSSQELRVFPQPAKDQMRIAFAYQGVGSVMLELYNVAGERVLHQEDRPSNLRGYGVTTLATKTLSSGIYFLNIKIDDAQGRRMLHQKIAIQH